MGRRHKRLFKGMFILLMACVMMGCTPLDDGLPSVTPMSPLPTTTEVPDPTPVVAPTMTPASTPAEPWFHYNRYVLPPYGRDFLGEHLDDYYRIMDALYDGISTVQLTTIQDEKEFSHVRRMIVAMFIPLNLLHDYQYLAGEGPFDFDPETQVLTIQYAFEMSVHVARMDQFVQFIETIQNFEVTDVQDDFETAKELYLFVVNHMDYVYYNKLNVYDAFTLGSGYCVTYAHMYQFLLWHAGIENYLVGNYDHEWNLVRIDGEFYHMDPTWDSGNLYYFGMSDRKCYEDTEHILYDWMSTDRLIDDEDFIWSIQCNSELYDEYYIEYHYSQNKP